MYVYILYYNIMRIQNMRSLSYRIASVTCALRREKRERKSAERERERETSERTKNLPEENV